MVERAVKGLVLGLALLFAALAAASNGYVAPYLFNMGGPYLLMGLPWESLAARSASTLHQQWLQSMISLGWVAGGTPFLWAIYFALLPEAGGPRLRKLVTLATVGLHLLVGAMQVRRELGLYGHTPWRDPFLDVYAATYTGVTLYLLRTTWTT